MRVVLDTNVLVEALSPRSRFHAILPALVEGHFEIAITNEILIEYEEVLVNKYGPLHAEKLLGFLSFSPSVNQVNPTYRYGLLTADPDDNKFVDCAVAAGADAIVTSDRHFQTLQHIESPRMRVLSPLAFLKEISHQAKE